MANKDEQLAAEIERIKKGGAEKYHIRNQEQKKLFARDRLKLLLDDGTIEFEDGMCAATTARTGFTVPIAFDAKQQMELWLTLGQAVVALAFLINMELAWWEATALAVLFAIPFFDSATEPVITWIYFGWAALEVALGGPGVVHG